MEQDERATLSVTFNPKLQVADIDVSVHLVPLGVAKR
jgi:hypothetical protein